MHNGGFFVFQGIIALVIVLASGIGAAWLDARRSVKKAPREPMTICDIHGVYPSRYNVYIEVPAMTGGKAELCPFCMRERVGSKKVPK